MATRSGAEPSEFGAWSGKTYGGVVVWEYCTELEQIKTMKVRDDDVWICTFPRSGTTLTQEITYLIQTRDFQKARTEVLEDRSPFVEILDPDPRRHMRGVKYVEGLESPRVIKSHLHYFMLPEQLKHGNGKADEITSSTTHTHEADHFAIEAAKLRSGIKTVVKSSRGQPGQIIADQMHSYPVQIVYLVRNPNACALSYYKLWRWFGSNQTKSLREYMDLFLNDQASTCPWWLHVLQYWEHRNDDNVLFLRFEDLVQNKKTTIQKIAEFVGKTLTEDELSKIDEHTDIDNMKGNAAVNYSWHEAEFKTNKDYGGFINNDIKVYDHVVTTTTTSTETSRIPPIQRSIDGWKGVMPIDIQERVTAMVQQRLGHTDLSF